ncbi:NADPH2:quinone reductase [Strigomonas culicis]|uniref:NADPH2:quinone reductase n=1 Tax=Strigomonas culicis TaxID=28005 RepID=S9VGS6_9TRYP|nr:NADPH2:quinone reductase [Strigomonas culicis]|eukprot:EPY26196.1 NADPH2:quinone reductase [Strigomonas culicis]
MALLDGGGYAEYAVAHEGTVMPMPREFSFIEAAAVPEAFLTAWQCLKYHGDVQPGQRVLIHAGASGVGTALAQLVERHFKATAITTSSAEKVDVCKSFASHALDRTPDEAGVCFAPKVKSLFGEESINLIIDPVVGGTYLSEDALCIANDGKIVVIGFMGGTNVFFSCLPLHRQRAEIIFSKLRSESMELKAQLVSTFEEEIVPLLSARKVLPVANKTYPLEEVKQAHTYLDDPKTWGKIVLTVNSPLVERAKASPLPIH